MQNELGSPGDREGGKVVGLGRRDEAELQLGHSSEVLVEF